VQHVQQLWRLTVTEATVVAPDVLKLARALAAVAQLGVHPPEEPKPTRTKPYRVREVAAILNVDRATIYREIARRNLVAERVGHGRGILRIWPDEFERYRQSRRDAAGGREDTSGE
jgi:excisionase family DNA binding protein